MKLVEDWTTTLWRAWSVRLTGFWALLLTYFSVYPEEWVKMLHMIPDNIRPLASMGMGIAMFASTGGARVLQQKSLTKETLQ